MTSRVTIADIKKIAKNRKGVCLSDKYVNTISKLDFMCEKGHHFSASSSSVKQGHWCRYCQMHSLSYLLMSANEHGGSCLSEKYMGVKAKHRWRCKEDHEWEATPDNIINNGRWCPKCALLRRLGNIEDIKKIAKERGGVCLSDRYINANSKLTFRCNNAHIFKSSSFSIKQGHWCRFCQSYSIEDLYKIAEERGGTCLSKRRMGVKSKHRWRCKEGHEWEATPDSIINQESWCPVCAGPCGVSEEICRANFENIFQKKFIKKRPRWLINTDGHTMELDGYNEKLGIAFEYNGKQHYHHINFFHSSKKNLRKRMIDDQIKRKLCIKNKIILIEIPYTIEKISMGSFIAAECKKHGLQLPTYQKINFVSLRLGSSDNLNRIKEWAQAKGGNCLSTSYIDAHTPLQMICSNGHQFMLRPNNFKKGHWCKKCRYESLRKNSFEIMKDIIEKKGGVCLSKQYINNRTKLEVRCKNGHVWKPIQQSITKGHWCPKCAYYNR